MDELLHQLLQLVHFFFSFFSLVCDSLVASGLVVSCTMMPLVVSRLIVSSYIEALSYKERFYCGFSPEKGFLEVNTCVYCG